LSEIGPVSAADVEKASFAIPGREEGEAERRAATEKGDHAQKSPGEKSGHLVSAWLRPAVVGLEDEAPQCLTPCAWRSAVGPLVVGGLTRLMGEIVRVALGNVFPDRPRVEPDESALRALGEAESARDAEKAVL